MAEHPTEILESYALHLLSPQTRDEVAEHLGGCPECQARLRDIERTLGFLAYAAPQEPPPEGAEERLFVRIADLRAGERRAQTGESAAVAVAGSAPVPASVALGARFVRLLRRPLWPARAVYALAGVAAALLIAIAILGWSLGAARDANDRLSAQVRQQQTALAILGDPNALVRRLGATEKAAGSASGTVAVNPANGAGAAVFAQLPSLPSGELYEFWVVQDLNGGQRITPSASFTAGWDGGALVRFTMDGPAGSMSNAGVSIERSGAPPNPHSPMILLVQA